MDIKAKKTIKYLFLALGFIFLLIISFLIHIYQVSYDTGYQPTVVTLNDEIKVSLSANGTGTSGIWLPFYSYFNREGPYKFVFIAEDLNKKYEKLEIQNAEFNDWNKETISIDFTSNKSEKGIFTKLIDPNYKTEYFHTYANKDIPINTSINVTINFILSNSNEEKQYKFKTFMELRTSVVRRWFALLSA